MSVPGAELGVDVGLGGGAGVARVDDDQVGAVVHGLVDPLEGDGVVLGRVAADDEDGSRCSSGQSNGWSWHHDRMKPPDRRL